MGSSPACPTPSRSPSPTGATTALVLGICGLTVCPVACSLLAVVKGRRARHAIEASEGRLSGHASATAGLVLGWVGLATVSFVLLIAASIIVPDLLSGGSEGLVDELSRPRR